MNKFLTLLLITTVLIVQSPTLQAKVTSINFGSELMNGDSTYQIGGKCMPIKCGFNDRFPISKLEFPMDMVWATAQVKGTLSDLNFDLQLKKSIISNEAKFKDSDWVQNVNPAQLDIYSESDSTVDGLMIDASIDMEFKPFPDSMNNYLGAGFIMQDLYFEARDTVQQYPSNPNRPTDVFPGLAITYQVNYRILYLYYRAHYHVSNTTRLNIKLGYSPIVNISDFDTHVFRDLTAKGELSGTAELADISIDYQFSKDTKLNFGFNYMGVTAEGIQTQAKFGLRIGSIEEKITSTQKSLSLRYYYQF